MLGGYTYRNMFSKSKSFTLSKNSSKSKKTKNTRNTRNTRKRNTRRRKKISLLNYF